MSIITNALPGVGEKDPTKSITLRRQYARAVRKRFRSLKGRVRKAIIEDDLLRIQTGGTLQLFQNQDQLIFTKKQEIEDRFNQWLQRVADDEILEAEMVSGPTREVASRNEWQNKYVRRAYGKGVKDADTRLAAGGVTDEDLMSEPVQRTFNKPIHAEKLNFLFSHNFEALKSIQETGRMAEAGEIVRQSLTAGLAAGKNPRTIAEEIVEKVNGNAISISESRAEAIARTEVIRAHHVSSINRYQEFGTQKVAAKGEISTAGDSLVCPRCLGIEGRRFRIREARSIIPLHVQCRCSVLPVTPLSDSGQRAVRRRERREQAQSRLRSDHGIDPNEFDPLKTKGVMKSRNFNEQAIGNQKLFTETQIENAPKLSEFTS